MGILGRYPKQPSERIDYPVSFAKWLAKRPGESIASYTVTAEPGINIVSHIRTGSVITVVLDGGTDGNSYKITVRITTALGNLIREADFIVNVSET